jgi:hypothetical protein
LLGGLLAVVSAAGSASALQRSQATLQDRARYAAATLSRAVREAGFRPEPWNDAYLTRALADTTADDAANDSDRLVLRDWSDRNCFDNLNPERDSDGRARFFLRERAFDLSSADNLMLQCRYGPSESELATQIARQGLVPGVESLQVLFAEDADGDGRVERWTRAAEWNTPDHVLGVKIALLVKGDEPVIEPESRPFSVLDTRVHRGTDGRLRRVFEFAAAIRGRSE